MPWRYNAATEGYEWEDEGPGGVAAPVVEPSESYYAPAPQVVAPRSALEMTAGGPRPPAYESIEPMPPEPQAAYFGGGGVERNIQPIYELSPKGESESPFPQGGNLEMRLPDISRYAPSTQFAPEFVDAGYRAQPRRLRPPEPTALSEGLQSAFTADPNAPATPEEEALRVAEKFSEFTSPPKPGEAGYQPNQSEAVQRAPFIGGLTSGLSKAAQTIAPAPAWNDPLGIAMSAVPGASGVKIGTQFLGRELPGVVKLGMNLAGADIAEGAQAAGRAVREGAEALPGAARRFAADETGAVPVGGDFFVRIHDPQATPKDFFRQVDAKPVDIPGFEDMDTFVHRDSTGKFWVVSEGETGLSVSSGKPHKTRAEAIASAEGNLEKIGRENTEAAMLRARAGAPANPRYPDLELIESPGLDPQVDKHFREWIHYNVYEPERDAVEQGMRTFLAEHLDNKVGNRSWPEIRALAERNGDIAKADTALREAEGAPVSPSEIAGGRTVGGPGSAEPTPELPTSAAEEAAQGQGVLPPVEPPSAAIPELTPLSREWDRLRGLKSPNAASVEASLKRLETEGYDVGDTRSALDDWREITRKEYDDAGSYRDDKDAAWENVLDELHSSERVEAGTLDGAPGTTGIDGGQSVPPQAGAAKQPWEMTRDEWLRSSINVRNPDFLTVAPTHKERVVAAIAEGKPVPPEVLADYPDLKAGAGAGEPLRPSPPDNGMGAAGAPPASVAPDVPGEPPRVPPEQPPTGLGADDVPPEGELPSRFASVTTPASDTMSDELRKVWRPVTYEGPRNTDAAYARADAVVAADPEHVKTRLQNKVDYNDDDIFQAQALILHLDQAGRSSDAMDVLEMVSLKLTEAGRTVQAASMWDRMSPTGFRLRAIRVIQKAIDEGTDKVKLGEHIAVQADEIAVTRVKRQHQEAIDVVKAARKESADIERFTKPMPFRDFRKVMADIFGDETGAVGLKRPMEYDPEKMQEFMDRGRRWKEMPDGPAKDAEKAAIKKDMDAYEAQVRAEAVPGSEARRDKELRQYMADRTKREVVPELTPADRQARQKLKQDLKASGYEIKDKDTQDYFIGRLEELRELPEDLWAEEVTRLVEELREIPGVLEGLRTGPPPRGVSRDKLLEILKADRTQLTNKQVRTVFQRLNTVDRLAVAQMKALLKLVDEVLPGSMADDFLVKSSDLRRFSPEEQPLKLKALMDEYREYGPIKEGLENRATVRDADALKRREARQVASDFDRMFNPKPEKPAALPNEDRNAINSIIKVFHDAEVVPPREVFEDLYEQAKALAVGGMPPEQALAARAALVNAAAEYPPVHAAQAAKAAASDAEKAVRAELAQKAREIEALTTPSVPKPPPFTPAQKKAVNGVVSLLRKFGVQLDTATGIALREQAQALKGMTPGPEMDAAVTAFVKQAEQLDPLKQAIAAQEALKAAKAAEIARAARLKRDAERFAISEKAGTLVEGEARFARFPELGQQAGELARERAVLGDVPVGDRGDINAALAEVRRKADTLGYLTEEDAAAAIKLIRTDEQKAIAELRAVRRERGAKLPDDTAEDFFNRATELREMGDPDPGTVEAAQKYIKGQELMHDIALLVPADGWDQFLDILNIPRSLKASFDLSAPLNQGALMIGPTMQNRGAWFRAFAPMVKSLKTENHVLINAMIHTRPMAKVGEDAGLFLAEIGGKLGLREELMASQVLERVPGFGKVYKGSNQAYVTFLNKLRADTFDGMARWINKGGYEATPQDYKDLAQFVNWMTGRGSLGDIARSKYANGALGNLLFSARMTASRFEAPLTLPRAMLSLVPGAQRLPYHLAYSKPVAVAIAMQWASSLMVLGTIYGLADMAGFGVETDLRSADWGKIKAGPHRIDLLGGEQQSIRFLAMAVTGQAMNSKGELVDADRWTALQRFARSKLSPQMDALIKAGTGKDFMGRPMTTERWVMEMLPFIIQGTAEVMKQGGDYSTAASVAALATLSLFGARVNSYKSTSDLQDEVANRLYGQDYDEKKLDKAQLRAVNNSKEVQESFEQIAANNPVDPRQEQRTAGEMWKERQKEQEDEYGPRILLPAGTTPEEKINNKRKAIQALKTARFEAGKTTFGKATIEAAREGKTTTIPKDMFAGMYWDAEAPEVNGEPDLTALRKMRQRIIEEARNHGVSEEYIKGTGLETYRGERFLDPKIRAEVVAYEKASETIAPYWDVRSEVNKQFPDATQRFKDAVIERKRQIIKAQNPAIRDALNTWYKPATSVTAPQTPAASPVAAPQIPVVPGLGRSGSLSVR